MLIDQDGWKALEARPLGSMHSSSFRPTIPTDEYGGIEDRLRQSCPGKQVKENIWRGSLSYYKSLGFIFHQGFYRTKEQRKGDPEASDG